MSSKRTARKNKSRDNDTLTDISDESNVWKASNKNNKATRRSTTSSSSKRKGKDQNQEPNETACTTRTGSVSFSSISRGSPMNSFKPEHRTYPSKEEVKEARERNAKLEEELKEKIEEIAKLKSVVKEKCEEIVSIRSVGKEKDKKIAELEEEKKVAESKLEEKDKKIASSNKKIAELEEDAKRKDQVIESKLSLIENKLTTNVESDDKSLSSGEEESDDEESLTSTDSPIKTMKAAPNKSRSTRVKTSNDLKKKFSESGKDVFEVECGKIIDDDTGETCGCVSAAVSTGKYVQGLRKGKHIFRVECTWCNSGKPHQVWDVVKLLKSEKEIEQSYAKRYNVKPKPVKK